jgi:hypothetical protein
MNIKLHGRASSCQMLYENVIINTVTVKNTDPTDHSVRMRSELLNAYISWRVQVNFQWDDDEVHFVLDQDAELDCYNASSLKQQSLSE